MTDLQLTAQPNPEMLALTAIQVGDARLTPTVRVAADTPLREAARRMRDTAATCVLVDGAGGVSSHRLRGEPGILTERELIDLVVIDGVSRDAPVGPHARAIQVVVSTRDTLATSLRVLTGRGDRRVVVAEAGEIHGVLELTDALALLTNNSRTIADAIESALSPEGLIAPSQDTHRLIGHLHGVGVRPRLIARLVTTLNRLLMRRLFEMVAAPEIVANTCLFVMGSEGRGEQLLKTDQDNGLIIRDGFDTRDLADTLTGFARHLEACGYPPCPGGVMVSNPAWTRTLSDYRQTIFDWFHHPNERGLMDTAIFLDSAWVAGDAALLTAARSSLFAVARDDQIHLLNFVKPGLAFETPSLAGIAAWFGHRRSEPLDIKKAGIFPLVHGLRTFALENKIEATHSLDRLSALVELGRIDADLGHSIIDAFDFLTGLRLEARLNEWDGARGNLIQPDRLTTVEHDRLRAALAVVRRFKRVVANHFHLQSG